MVVILGLCPAPARAQPRAPIWDAAVQVVYHLNLRTFVRAVLQYTDIMRDPTLYLFPIAASARQLFSQYLFSYKVNPQTVFLVGYSDNASAAQTTDLMRTDRTFFTKIGYAWVP